MTLTSRSVTVAVPVLNEAAHIEACLTSIVAQTYPDIVEILVIDGGSDDETRTLAHAFPKTTVLDNPGRIQSAGLNVALAHARGEVIVRVDGHCRLAPDYVERCVHALTSTGAAMVGGAMVAEGEGWLGSAIAAALSSRVGAGTARFHTGGSSGFVDTVYLGAFRRRLALDVGGYAPVAINEDAEFAIRMAPHGGIWFDPRIASRYTPRRNLARLGRQFFRYGRGRAVTVRRHPHSLAGRQLAAPLLVLFLLTPWRLAVAGLYATLVGGRALMELRRSPRAAAGLLVAIPTMHLPWGVGFLSGILSPSRRAVATGEQAAWK